MCHDDALYKFTFYLLTYLLTTHVTDSNRLEWWLEDLRRQERASGADGNTCCCSQTTVYNATHMLRLL